VRRNILILVGSLLFIVVTASVGAGDPSQAGVAKTCKGGFVFTEVHSPAIVAIDASDGNSLGSSFNGTF
jgi:hypothetical protein